jgi:ribosomal RNA-processing protein 8
LATLRALEAASLSQQTPSLPGSDSEEEEEVGRKKRHLQRPSLASVSKEVGKKRKGKCQKQAPSISDSEGKEIRRKCHRQAPPLGGVSAGEEKGKRKCQEYSSLHLTQPLDSVDQTGISMCEYGGGEAVN